MVVFDLDDTLYFEADYVRSAVDAVATFVAGCSDMTFEVAKAIVQSAPSVGAGFDLLAERAGANVNGEHLSAAAMVKVYRTHMPYIALRSGAAQLLDALKSRGIRIGMITDGRCVTQINKYKALGLEKYILESDFLVSEATGADKNSPKPFERMMLLHPDETNWVYIGDNPAKDFHWPNVFGWTTIEIANPPRLCIHPQTIEVEELWKPRHIVDELPKALAYIMEFH